MSKLLAIFWPSFVSAIFGEFVFFALIDPQQLYLLGEPVDWSRIAVYSVGFLMFWALTALAVALSLMFQKPASELNLPHLDHGGPASRPGK